MLKISLNNCCILKAFFSLSFLVPFLIEPGLCQDEPIELQERIYLDVDVGFGNAVPTNFRNYDLNRSLGSQDGDFSPSARFEKLNLGVGYQLSERTSLKGHLTVSNLLLEFQNEQQQYLYGGNILRASLSERTFLNKSGDLRPFHGLGVYYSFGGSGTPGIFNLTADETISNPFQNWGMTQSLGLTYQDMPVSYELYFQGFADVLGDQLRMAGFSIHAGVDVYVFDLFGSE